MKIKIKVHSNSSQEKTKEIDSKNFEVWLKEKAVDNKANTELTKILKKYFKTQVNIVSGFTSRNKIVEVFE
ncbi:DUF167 domain-containing protein [Candidatus Pacearchaeota archaeon]|nr:DUF167 domain-containing protein [Candidatus Pacearchaeota archaeon]